MNPENDLILVDLDDREIGRGEKMDVHRRGLLHRAFSVFLFSGDRLLVQRRAAGKYHSAGLWANTCCSHPRPGQALPEFPPHLLLLRHDIDQGDDVPDPAVLIEQRFLDDLQEFLFPLVLLNDMGGALPGADQLQVGVQRPLGVLLVLADVQVRFSADGPVRIVLRVQVVPRLGRKDVTGAVVLQVDIGRKRLEHPGKFRKGDRADQLFRVRQPVLQHSRPNGFQDAVHHHAAQVPLVRFDMLPVRQDQDRESKQVVVPVVDAADQPVNARDPGRRIQDHGGKQLAVFQERDGVLRGIHTVHRTAAGQISCFRLSSEIISRCRCPYCRLYRICSSGSGL